MARRNLRYDFQLAGKGYMLSRATSTRGRAWTRQGTPDTPLRVNSRTEEQAKYGGLDPQIDYPEVWDDWSGGYGHAYREDAQPNTYHWSENMDARFPKQLVHAQKPLVLRTTTASDAVLGTGNMGMLTEGVDEMVDMSILDAGWRRGQGVLVALGAWGRIPLTPNASTWVGVQPSQWTASPYGNLHPAVVFGNYYYWGRPCATYFTASDFATDTVISSPGYRFAVAGNQLWRAHGSSTDLAFYLQNCGNPNATWTLANWGATYNLGNYRAPVQDLIGVDDQVFAGTPDGLYAGDQTGTFINVLSQLSKQSHPDNCRDLTIFEGAVVAPHIAGVFAYRPSSGVVEDMSPPRSDRSPVTGRVRALRGYGRYLYGGLYTGSSSYLLAGERQGQDIAWHTLQRFPHNTKISRFHVDSFTTSSGGEPLPSHFWATTEASIDTSGTCPTYWWNIPSLDGNPLSPSPAFSANYCGSARIDFGSSDWNAPGTNKVYRSVEMVSENLASGAQWADVYYTIDETARTKLGTIAQSPNDILYFPTSPDHEKELVQNGGFEEALAGTWTEYANGGTIAQTSTAAEVHSGNLALKLTADASVDTAVEGVYVVNPTRRHRLIFWTRGDATYAGRYKVYDGTNAADIISIISTGVVGAGYVKKVVDFSTPAGCVQVKLSFWCPATNAAWACFDDVSLQERAAVGQNIRLSLESFTASAGITPVYRSVVLRGALQPRSTDEITAVVRIADDIQDWQQQPMRSAATMLGELRDLSNPDRQGIQAHELIDLAGAVWNVKLIGPPREQEVYNGTGPEPPEIAATIRMAVLNFSGG